MPYDIGEPQGTQQFFQHSPFNIDLSVTEINQVRKSLLRTSHPSRLQMYTALMVKPKKTVQRSELFPGLGISAPVLCSPIHFPHDFMQVLWTTVSRCRPQRCVYGIFGQAPSTDELLAGLVSFEKEPKLMGSVINYNSSRTPADQGTWGRADPKGLPLPEQPGNPPAGSRQTLELKPWGNDNTHDHPITRILLEIFCQLNPFGKIWPLGPIQGLVGYFALCTSLSAAVKQAQVPVRYVWFTTNISQALRGRCQEPCTIRSSSLKRVPWD